MTRDAGLEELLREDLQGRTGLTEKTMFGGRVWLLNGNLLCGARTDGMLVRLGKGNDGWAFEMPGVASMVMGQRQMHGWVRLAPGAWGLGRRWFAPTPGERRFGLGWNAAPKIHIKY